MKYVIYIDVFFCVNLVMDFLILKLVSLYIKPQTTYIRCILGAILGSAFGVLSLLISYENIIWHMLFSYIFIAVAMVVGTFGLGTRRELIKRCIVLYVVTIFLGGLINLLYSYTYMGVFLQNLFWGLRNTTNILWMIGATFFTYICLKALVRIAKRNSKTNMLVAVKLVHKGKERLLTGLIDTGNSLREPYTGKPVHIVCEETISSLLESQDLHTERFKLVPFTSVGKNHGLIKVITIDELWVYTIEDTLKYTNDAIYIKNEVAIGLYEGSLSNVGEFQMLLHNSVSL
ncbi:MAG: sigma-E processing peptidase SpoIIGA [Lachnospiraceae bacterium]|nr:sigma-E processing peptidase SpoIIGA [Lachnospiraceae bacterium]MEE0862976.1 sigma-E processing peptidase SpoIIGA [Lachnospiraceae bacterium]